MERRSIETILAWFSLLSATVHFAGETAYQIRYGQYLPMLIVDYIAVALTLYAVWHSLRGGRESAAGLLAGAWGFTFCLNYITFFGRLARQAQGATAINGEPPSVMIVLCGLLFFSGTAYALSLFLAAPRKPGRQA